MANPVNGRAPLLIDAGLLLGAVAYVLAREMRSLLIGERASVETERVIRQTILADGFVERIVGLRTLQIGPDALLVTARVELEHHLSHDAVADRLDRIEASLRGHLPGTAYIYLEPQLANRSDPGLPGDLQNLSMLRFVARDGSEIAQGQAAALRALLRGQPPEGSR